MINNEKKFRCDFSFRHYFETLKAYEEDYSIVPLNQFKNLKKNESYILLRHDVDVSLDAALKMAKKEKKHHFKSTYFILLNSPYYNALSLQNSKIISEISEMGHEIGLHYDTTMMSNNSKKIIQQLKHESDLLSEIIGKKITSVAQHNTSITKNIQKNIKKEKFLDSMNPTILNKVEYLSDSVQNWRKGCMCNHIGKYNKMQILTHPFWWNDISIKRKKIWQIFYDVERKKLNLLIKKNNLLHKYYFEVVLKNEKFV